jgi:hypothetical protein
MKVIPLLFFLCMLSGGAIGRCALVSCLGRIVASFVTPDDCASEPDASDAAEQLIKAL